MRLFPRKVLKTSCRWTLLRTPYLKLQVTLEEKPDNYSLFYTLLSIVCIDQWVDSVEADEYLELLKKLRYKVYFPNPYPYPYPNPNPNPNHNPNLKPSVNLNSNPLTLPLSVSPTLTLSLVINLYHNP